MEAFVVSGVSSALIDASSNAFMFYSSGILSANSGCHHLIGNFWVALVGYYTSSLSTPYWTIQNSWGTGWGEQGYANIAIDTFNGTPGVCGV